jgi:hypothetical protein
MLKVNRMGAKSEEMKEANNKALLIHVEKRRSGWLSFFMITLMVKCSFGCSYLKQTNPIETYQ